MAANKGTPAGSAVEAGVLAEWGFVLLFFLLCVDALGDLDGEQWLFGVQSSGSVFVLADQLVLRDVDLAGGVEATATPLAIGYVALLSSSSI